MTNNGGQRVALIGLGLMGAALGGALLKGGTQLTVWNRSADKASGLVGDGAALAGSIADAVASSPIVVLCVSDYAAVGKVVDAAGGGFAGKTVVNLTSATPEEARAMSERITASGAEYVDGAILSVPQGIGQPEAVLLHTGSQQGFTTAEPVLGHLGTNIYLGPDAGVASLYDLGLLGILWSTVAGFLHALALVGTEKISAVDFAPMAGQWLAGVATFLPELARQVDEGKYETEVSSVNVNAAAIDHLVHASKSQGIGVAVHAPIKALIDQSVANGHGEHSLASLVELIRKQS